MFARDARIGVWFILPTIALLSVLLLIPLVLVVYQSLAGADTFPSLAFYREVIRDETFWIALRNTTVFTLASVGGHIILGLIIALLANTLLPGQRLFRNIALLPWMLPPAVVATTWSWLYHMPFGLINPLLQDIGFLKEPIAWLSTTETVMPAVIVANIWRGTPFVSIILLAGLQSIPDDTYEAASVDGAGSWQQFWTITLPLLRRAMTIALLLDVIGTVKYFDLIWVMTQGGPAHRTEVFATLIYRYAFVFFRPGPAAALAVMMLLVLGVLTYRYITVISPREV